MCIYDESSAEVYTKELTFGDTEITIDKNLAPNSKYSWDIVCKEISALYKATNEADDEYNSYYHAHFIIGDGSGMESISADGPRFFVTGD